MNNNLKPIPPYRPWGPETMRDRAVRFLKRQIGNPLAYVLVLVITVLVVAAVALYSWRHTSREAKVIGEITADQAAVIPSRAPVPMRQAPANLEPEDYFVGTKRKGMDEAHKQIRILQLNEAMTFVPLKQKDSSNAAKLGLKFNKLVTDEFNGLQKQHPNEDLADSFAQQTGLARENIIDLGLAILWKESNFNPNARSPTGPRGIAGIAMGTAGDYKMQLVPIYETNADGSIKKDSKGKPVISTETVNNIKYFRFSTDDRMDPQKSVRVMWQYLYWLLHRPAVKGRWDLAVTAYHSGPGNVAQLVQSADGGHIHDSNGKLVEDDKGKKLEWKSYEDIFFCDFLEYPDIALEMYDLASRKGDFGSTYWAGVRRGMELMWFAWTNPKGYQALADQQRYKSKFEDGDNADEARYRFLSWLGDADLLYDDIGDLQAAIARGKADREHTGDIRHELMAMPRQAGLSVRTGKDGVGSALEGKNKQYVPLFATMSPAATGCAQVVAAHMLRFGNPKLNLVVTSMVRTKVYQDEANKREKPEMPSHVTGLAFDFTRKGLTPLEIAQLTFILNDFEYAGLLSWIPEGAYGAFHIVVPPSPTIQARYAQSID